MTSALSTNDDKVYATGISGKVRITHLTSIHPAFDVRIFHKECKTLVAAGYNVSLVAPHGQSEIVGGVHIIPVIGSNSRIRRMTGTVWDVYRRALETRPDICHLHDPELLPVGALLKLAGIKVIYDAHEDLAADVLIKQWINSKVRRSIAALSRGVEWLAARGFDAVISATPTIASNFPVDRRVLVQNFPILDELSRSTSLPYNERGSLVLYVGSITSARGAHEMVQAIGQVPGAKLILIGKITPTGLEEEISAESGWKQVDYLGILGRVEVAENLGRARVGLVLLQPVPSYVTSQPTKLFEYMSVGIPVITSNFPAWRELIDRIGCGLTVDPLNAREIAEAVKWMLLHPSEAEAMGKRGQVAMRSSYNWSSEARSLLKLYEQLLA